MKADRGQIERAMAAASDAVRLYLLYGPDEAALFASNPPATRSYLP
jgi:hypothetical protein